MTAARDHGTGVAPDEAVLVVAGFVALAAANLVFWRFDYPPLIDWPNHLARHALQCAADPLAGLGQYYEYTFEWVPNLSSELVHALPVACQSLLTTQKVLIQFATTGLLASAVILHFAVWRRWSVWPLLAASGMYHVALGYGFENYVLALPPMLLALALWFALRDKGPLARLLPLAAAAGAVYVLHLYAFVFQFAAVGLLELQKWWRARQWREFVAVGLLMALMAAGPVAHLALVATGTEGIDLGKTDFGTVFQKLTLVLSPFTPLGLPYIDPRVLWVAASHLLALSVILIFIRALGLPLELTRGAGLALGGLMVLTLAMPATLGAVHLTDIRLPVVLLCFAIAVTDVRLPPWAAAVFVLAVVAGGISRTSWLEARWAAHDREVRELLSLKSVLSDRDRLLVARAGPERDVLLHSHSASHLAREAGVFLPEIFSGGNALSSREAYRLRDVFQTFPVEVARLIEEARAPRMPDPDRVPYGELYWAAWPEFYSHILVLGRSGESFPEVPEFGRIVHRGSFFALYEAELAGR